MTKPTVALINNVSEAHLEGFGSIEGVLKAKTEIFLGLSPEGIAVINADDNHFSFWQDHLSDRARINFGVNPTATNKNIAINITVLILNLSFLIRVRNSFLWFPLPIIIV